MGKKEADPNAELDEHGLVVRKHLSTVLVVMPAKDYDETTMRYARSALHNIHVHTRSVSNDGEGLIKGSMQDEFQVDGELSIETLEPYSGVLFCGGAGALELAQDANALRLAREADAQDKLIGAWGHSILVLAQAGILKKRRVTGHRAHRAAVEAAGGRFTGLQVQRDGRFVTGLDDASGFRFGKALVQSVVI